MRIARASKSKHVILYSEKWVQETKIQLKSALSVLHNQQTTFLSFHRTKISAKNGILYIKLCDFQICQIKALEFRLSITR